MVKKVFFLFIIFSLLTNLSYAQDIIDIKKGEEAPFDGVLLSAEAAAKVLNASKTADELCELEIEKQLIFQKEKFNLELSLKDIEISSWKERYDSMLTIKTEENLRLQELIFKQKPSREPWALALGYSLGIVSSLGIYAISVEIAKQ